MPCWWHDFEAYVLVLVFSKIVIKMIMIVPSSFVEMISFVHHVNLVWQKKARIFPYFTIEWFEDWRVSHLPPESCFRVYKLLHICLVAGLFQNLKCFVEEEKNEPKNSLVGFALLSHLLISWSQIWDGMTVTMVSTGRWAQELSL